MRKFTCWMALLMIASACQQNPYKGTPEAQDPANKPEKPAPQPEPEPEPEPEPDPDPSGSLALDIDEEMYFTEGQKAEYIVQGSVKTPGKPIIEFVGLPNGVTYDHQNSKLVWTPDYQAANDPSNPLITVRRYPIKVKVHSDVNPGEEMSRSASLFVQDTPLPAEVKSGLEQRTEEGQLLTHTIEFVDNEFPTGPFEVAFIGLPDGAVMTWPNPSIPKFILRWTPQHNLIINKAFEDFPIHVALFNPRGRRLEFDLIWHVANKLAPPVVVAPRVVNQDSAINFSTLAMDVNGEESPRWAVQRLPPYGQFSVSTDLLTVNPGELPRSGGIVSWTGIPQDKLGLAVDVQIRACVKSSTCTYSTIRLTPGLPPLPTSHQGAKR
ncbi:MAG: hypothetical protein AB7F86_01985 [Bdellovibrionales bacterium]